MKLKPTVKYAIIGSLLGYIAIHPLVMITSHLMFANIDYVHILTQILVVEIPLAFSVKMLTWGLSFAALGACIGYLYGKFKQEEHALREANATKDRFFFILAHDLRNPLHVALLNMELLVHDYDRLDDEKRKLYLKRIYESSERVSTLVEDVLTWARTHAGKMSWNPQHIDLAAMTKVTMSVLRAQAAHKQITLHEEIPGNTRVYGDVNMVAAIMRNLVANAIKFTPEGGEITISSHNGGRFHTISVSDTGVGMGEEQLQRLFHIDKSFSTPGTANERGTGLGLVLCKEFVEQHGGEIRVDSDVGKGSRFTFTLPRMKRIEQ